MEDSGGNLFAEKPLRYIELICKRAYFVNFSLKFLSKLDNIYFLPNFRSLSQSLLLQMPPSPPPGLSDNDCFEEIVSEEKFKFIWINVRNIKFEHNLFFFWMDHDCRVVQRHSVWGTSILFRKLTAYVRRFIKTFFL